MSDDEEEEIDADTYAQFLAVAHQQAPHTPPVDEAAVRGVLADYRVENALGFALTATQITAYTLCLNRTAKMDVILRAGTGSGKSMVFHLFSVLWVLLAISRGAMTAATFEVPCVIVILPLLALMSNMLDSSQELKRKLEQEGNHPVLRAIAARLNIVDMSSTELQKSSVAHTLDSLSSAPTTSASTSSVDFFVPL